MNDTNPLIECQLKSKSQKKREADALRQLGVQLLTLSSEKLNTIPLSPNLRQAIQEAKLLKSHGAQRRQAQLIGKLMRSDDHEAIQTAFDELLAENNAKTADFQLIENWRERLLSEGKSALTEFIHHHQSTDRQLLRQLIRKAIDEQNKAQNTGANKALFRFIRSCF